MSVTTHKMDLSREEKLESQNEVQQQPTKGTSFLRTCFNGLNALSGVGIVSIPYALSQGGWISLVLLFLVAVLCWYTGLLLRRCMNTHPLIKTYPDIGEHAFGYKGRAIVSVFMYVELYLVAVEFLILEGAVDKVGFNESGVALNWSGMPISVLFVCFVTSTISYGSMAVLGYLMYGEHLKSQVTLNLPIKKMSTKIAICTTLINPLTKYAIITTPIATTIEEKPVFRNSRIVFKCHRIYVTAMPVLS
ncbi:Detected protein of unknown function [Hibiscus syriacus]|uniref:Amino acid transporter transmembrane domain-containing protein n=1 Tax=Hibiscus syriacus TaxID=106335 RepID=A0A6A3CQL3_HIBSY|nr:Detected protein of unknown function [Hibiscus syriacus]